jgi:hypothetical protein
VRTSAVTWEAPEVEPPREVFAPWRPAQRAVGRLAGQAPPAPSVLRGTGFLPPDVARSVADWFTAAAPPGDAVHRSYQALARETERLFEITQRHLGVRVSYLRVEGDPYDGAAELCAELREHGSMMLTTIAGQERHPLLDSAEGGIVDQLRVVHDVFGHAALGVGFDLQSEFATWLQCRTLFSDEARPAAFCELVGAVTAFVTTGAKPGLRAALPPAGLLAACEPDLRLAEPQRRP